MMFAKKLLLTFLVVAVLVACIEGAGYGRGYGRRGYGGYGGYGQRYNQGNRGGSGNLAQDQGAYNVNYGKGDLNNNQRSQTAQGVSQENQNGRYGSGY